MTHSFSEDDNLPDKPKRKRTMALWRRSYSVPLVLMLAVLVLFGILVFNLLKLMPSSPLPEDVAGIRYITITATPGQFTAPNTFTTWINYPGIPTPSEGTAEAQEAEFDAFVTACSELSVPAGGKFVFRHPVPNNIELFRVDEDGSNLCRLTTNEKLDDYPAWSPDGSQLVFVSDSEGYGIYVMDSDGTNRRQVFAKGTAFSFPDWSPNGQFIIFQATIDGLFDLYVVNIDGTGLRNLTADLRLDTMPAWSPDGHTIVFASDRMFNPAGVNLLPQDESYDIYVINADDGRNVLRLTNNTGSDILPAWSPDGETIAFQSQLYYSDVLGIMNKNGSALRTYPLACGSPVWVSNAILACLNGRTLYKLDTSTDIASAELQPVVTFPTSYGYFDYLDYTPGQPADTQEP